MNDGNMEREEFVQLTTPEMSARSVVFKSVVETGLLLLQCEIRKLLFLHRYFSRVLEGDFCKFYHIVVEY